MQNSINLDLGLNLALCFNNRVTLGTLVNPSGSPFLIVKQG